MARVNLNKKISVDKALRILNKKLTKENYFNEMKDRRFYQKPSEIKHKKNKKRKRNKKK